MKPYFCRYFETGFARLLVVFAETGHALSLLSGLLFIEYLIFSPHC